MILLNGDCLEKLKELADNSVDSLVTDPPAGISFMGKAWDDDKGGRKQWCAWMETVMRECMRVMKPGAHGLVWAIPRTSHWTATALEDAGFEIRDVVTHLFGSGFPKSHNLEKSTNGIAKGQGTALKPANEHWILIRKPCSEKTVAANVLRWGTGGINIDAGRIGQREKPQFTGKKRVSSFGGEAQDYKNPNFYDGGNELPAGRFPTNLVLSHSEYCTEEMCDMECAIKALDAQSGTLKSGANPTKRGSPKFRNSYAAFEGQEECIPARGADQGGASRFFYCAKISSKERNAGLEHLEPSEAPLGDDRPSGQSMSRLDGRPPRKAQNTHPTVKPKKLMAYLIKLITPPNGVVLDCFMGSGSTGIAAKECGFDFIGIEKEKEYFEIAKARINA